MSISFKKILLISIALLFGVMGSSVYAQVTETITFSSGAFAGQSYSVTETGAPFPGASSFNSTNMAWFGNIDLAQALAKAAATDSVLINYANAHYAGNTPFFASSADGSSAHGFFANSSTAPTETNYAYGGWGVLATGSAVAGAPEIDGSLAPKVGFLLGCLFLMFGRKKQNTEALLTA